MPTISRFLGIIVQMFFREHGSPHFHVEYAEHKATIDIVSLGIIEGQLPPRVHSIVIEWASIHKDELMKDWELCRNGKNPLPIEPLT
jgi:hypothetical protein